MARAHQALGRRGSNARGSPRNQDRSRLGIAIAIGFGIGFGTRIGSGLGKRHEDLIRWVILSWLACTEDPVPTQTRTAAEMEVDTDLGTKPALPDIRVGIRLLARLARVAERTCLESGVSLPQCRLLVSASGRVPR